MQNSLVKILILVAVATSAMRAALPDGPGKEATIRVCGRCHSPERAASLHQDRDAWEETITKMVKLGAQGSDDEFEAILGYLSKNFAKERPGPVDINTARPADMEADLLLLRHEAKAIVAYRQGNGPFKSFDDLKKVPGLNFQKLESKRTRIVF